jgi:putative endonuclease
VAFVYLLRCADGSLYCGWTTDLARRLAAHTAGRASRYTASRRPVMLAAAWRTATRSDARRLEVRVKRLPRAAKLRLVAGEALAGAEVWLSAHGDAGSPPGPDSPRERSYAP